MGLTHGHDNEPPQQCHTLHIAPRACPLSRADAQTLVTGSPVSGGAVGTRRGEGPRKRGLGRL